MTGLGLLVRWDVSPEARQTGFWKGSDGLHLKELKRYEQWGLWINFRFGGVFKIQTVFSWLYLLVVRREDVPKVKLGKYQPQTHSHDCCQASVFLDAGLRYQPVFATWIPEKFTIMVAGFPAKKTKESSPNLFGNNLSYQGKRLTQGPEHEAVSTGAILGAAHSSSLVSTEKQ